MDNHRIWVVDRSKLFREGLKLLLKNTPFTVTREETHIDLLGGTPAEKPLDLALRAAPSGAAREQADLILVAVQSDLAPGNPEEVALSHLCRTIGAPVLVLADVMSVYQLKAALKAGAAGYLLRDISPEALKQYLQLAVIGEKVLPPNLASVLTDVRAPVTVDDDSNLSPQEKRILDNLARGHSNKAIGRELDISEGTVKVHLKTIFRKIDARNRTDAAIWALNRGYGGDV